MNKHSNSGNFLLLALLSTFLLSGCGAFNKIAGSGDEEELTSRDSIYFVQAGAFHNDDYAHERAKELSRKFTYRIEITENKNLHRIRLGPFDEKPKAKECKNVLIKEGYEDAFMFARRDTTVQQE
ncbi:MAG: SPOR domain-containing protein [Bacteroidales bacterium]